VAKAVNFLPLTMEVSFGFAVDKVAVGQVFVQLLWVSFINFISPMLHAH
jgi:hypothetical protein